MRPRPYCRGRYQAWRRGHRRPAATIRQRRDSSPLTRCSPKSALLAFKKGVVFRFASRFVALSSIGAGEFTSTPGMSSPIRDDLLLNQRPIRLTLIPARAPGWGVLRALAMVSILVLWPRAGSASNLSVTVEGIDGSRGHILVAVCAEDQFLRAGCTFTGKAPAAPGAIMALIPDIIPGVYAVQVFHDENDNMDLDRSLLGFPKEGMGFSNDAPMRYGPPRFADAAIEIDGPEAATRLTMRYFDSERRALAP